MNQLHHFRPGGTVEIGGPNASHNHMQVTLERVKIDLDEDEIRRLIEAVDHYEAYLHSQQRDETEISGVGGSAQEDAG
jgi:hypothetical protein